MNEDVKLYEYIVITQLQLLLFHVHIIPFLYGNLYIIYKLLNQEMTFSGLIKAVALETVSFCAVTFHIYLSQMSEKKWTVNVVRKCNCKDKIEERAVINYCV